MAFNFDVIKKDPYLEDNRENIECIYNKMLDERSKNMYHEAISLIATRDFSHLMRIHELNSIQSDEIIRQQVQYTKLHKQGKKIVFYGLGERTLSMMEDAKTYGSRIGFSFIPAITDIPITCFCDRNYQNYPNGFSGLPVISPDELKQSYKDAVVLINTKIYFEEIRDELIQAGFQESNLFLQAYCNCVEYDDKQYFESFMKRDKESLFVDAGCFDGKTTQTFIKWQPNYDKIIAFEPDSSNFFICQQSLKDRRGVTVINAGLSDRTGECFFAGGGASASHIDGQGSESIRIVKLDDVIKDNKVSFIKMDIEGAELDALKGAAGCIKRDLPNLAICAYHKKYDLIDLPNYISTLSNHYRFYLRLYSNHWHEWVLYAVAD